MRYKDELGSSLLHSGEISLHASHYTPEHTLEDFFLPPFDLGTTFLAGFFSALGAMATSGGAAERG